MRNFVFSKKQQLFLQSAGMTLVMLSYLLMQQYFAMVGLAVALSRTLTFFIYESKDKKAPLALSFLFAGLTLLSYFVVNVIILEKYASWDILYLTVLVSYAFIFRIRNPLLMRSINVIPMTSTIVYGFCIEATPFVLFAYFLDCSVNLIALIQQDLLPKCALKRKQKRENNDELHT